LQQRPLQLGCHEFRRALRNDPRVHDNHDQSDDGAARVHSPHHQRRARITQIKGQYRGSSGIGECFCGLADRIMLVWPHGAFAQPQHITSLVMQGYGVGAIRFDCRADFLANGIEIDKRTIRLH
jgi:hypothetical protein